MAESFNPIPTPWRVRWMRIRYQFVPVVTLALVVCLTGWLWSRHVGSGMAVGEVEAQRIPVTIGVDGVLAPLPRVVKQYDRVSEGDVIAALDPTPIEARRAARRVEVDRLRAEIEALEGIAPGAAPRAQPATAPAAGAASTADRLQSLRTALATREEELGQIEAMLASLEVTAPVSGTVSRIYLRPGQFARAGDPIMEIFADGATYVVSFLREEQRHINPRKNMPVEVRPRTDPSRVVLGTVDTVGAQVEPVPAHQLRDQKIPEWGLPVRMAIPADSNLRPGELVNLTFPRGGAAGE